ncbi:transposase [Kocuria sp. SL71]|uniref:transposase n=1 Tax=Kocuria sp. SL71 TaxID=2995151 RepID=UPI002272830E|nr:transposase [Kocuria sp. SL71]MCY1683856.1 transposase [Kocuria sp. SL71]
MPKKFTPEFRERAVRMVFERQAAEGGPRAASIRVVAESLSCGPETLRAWCNQAITASIANPAAPTDESLGEENRRLRRELAEARRANEMADSSGERKELCELL